MPRNTRKRCVKFTHRFAVSKAERKNYAPISRWGAQIFTGWGAQNLTVNPNK